MKTMKVGFNLLVRNARRVSALSLLGWEFSQRCPEDAFCFPAAWARAFDVTDINALYLAPERRVRIWN
jgi:hypothetical protein